MLKTFSLFIAVFWTTVALAETHDVLMLSKDANGNRMIFAPEVIHVKSGDTVTWIAQDRNHNVEMIATPNDMKFKSPFSKDVSLTFTEPGIYYYWCTAHKSMAMIGLVVVDGDLSNMDAVANAKAPGMTKEKLMMLLKDLKS